MRRSRCHGYFLAVVLTAALALSACTADQKARAYAADDRDAWLAYGPQSAPRLPLYLT